ncbi:MAG: hypothetical protein F6K00_27000 [Leptolyngbya sp. SIOISBB]|nr:hypothetical protein [Leptolyngbya sp. SIOISBB]
MSENHTKRTQPQKRSAWVSTSTLANELGVTSKHIRQRLKDKVLKPSEHYRNINPHAWRPTYRWHLKKCLEAVESSSLA